MEHAEPKSFVIHDDQSGSFYQIQRILIPAATCTLLVVGKHVPILKVRQPGQSTMTMFQKQDQSSRPADAFHFVQCLDGIRKRAGGQCGSHRVETSIREFKFLHIHDMGLDFQVQVCGSPMCLIQQSLT